MTKLCREFIGLLNKATRRGRLDPSLRVQLQSLGQDLYDNLLPLSVKERLQGREESDLVIHIEDRLVHIPWELLFDGEQFLCRRFNLGRIVTTRQRTPHFQQRKYDPPLSMLLLYDPKGDLPAARQEGMLIRNTLDLYVDRVHISSKTRNIRTDYIRRSIRDFDIVHYAGHATYDSDDPSQSGWLVKEGTVTAALLVKMKGIRPLPSLVFSNASVYVGLGACYLDRYHRGFEPDIRLIDRAIEYCNKALEIDPEQADSYHVLAMAYRSGKYDYKAAVDYDSRAIEIRPGYLRAHYTLGLAYKFLVRL